MSMKKIQLTTYWSANDADTILMFINELRDRILAHYAQDIADHHRQMQHEQDPLWLDEFENDIMF